MDRRLIGADKVVVNRAGRRDTRAPPYICAASNMERQDLRAHVAMEWLQRAPPSAFEMPGWVLNPNPENKRQECLTRDSFV